MRFITGVVLGVAVTVVATAFAGSTAPSPIPAPRCHVESTVSHACTFSALPVGALGQYTLNFPGIDLACIYGADEPSLSLAASLTCDRLSLNGVRCNDGLLGSMSAVITVRRMEIDEPQTCVAKTAPPGFKILRGYT